MSGAWGMAAPHVNIGYSSLENILREGEGGGWLWDGIPAANRSAFDVKMGIRPRGWGVLH